MKCVGEADVQDCTAGLQFERLLKRVIRLVVTAKIGQKLAEGVKPPCLVLWQGVAERECVSQVWLSLSGTSATVKKLAYEQAQIEVHVRIVWLRRQNTPKICLSISKAGRPVLLGRHEQHSTPEHHFVGIKQAWPHCKHAIIRFDRVKALASALVIFSHGGVQSRDSKNLGRDEGQQDHTAEQEPEMVG